MAIWSALEAGDVAKAKGVIERQVLPVSRFGFQDGDLFYHIHKQLLVRLGVIATAKVRTPTTTLDALTAEEMDEVLSTLLGQAR